MAEWVRLCAANEAPKRGEVTEIQAGSVQICLANVEGELRALANLCPHRQGPLGQGWIEGQAVICPWHAWAFDTCSGICTEPEQAQVQVFPIREERGEIVADLA